jgi:signal transduction histidine kinase/DNA-binding NarL/FixJ family response regulator
MTLYKTKTFNFNINYNPNLKETNLWINAPVFDNDQKPIGMVGTGVRLSDFVDTIFKNHTGQADLYFFNSLGEITGAKDVGLVESKKKIADEFGAVGAKITGTAKNLQAGEARSFKSALGEIAVRSVPVLNWYIVAVRPITVKDYNMLVTALFLVVYVVMALVFVVFNIFIAGLIKPLRNTMTSLENALKAKSEFLAKVSHEIRTPMNAILGIAEIQLQKNTLAPDIKEAIGKISNSGYSLLGIINDILDSSKIEAGKMELTLAKYDTASLINDAMQLNMLRVGNKFIDMKLRVDENIPSMLFGDELRIKQILNNLLSNAVKYTEKGRVELAVLTELTNAAAGSDVPLIFRISDTGHGMTQEQIERLFKETYIRFNNESNRNTEGTGLGISITKNLVQLMGGTISIESAPHVGTTFTVRIPQGNVGSPPIGEELAENLQKFRFNSVIRREMYQITRDYMPYGSVLVVDDVETNLYVANGLMAPYGLKIDTVSSGYEAIELVKGGNTYDIIFMDHMMPGMNGIEAARIIRVLGYANPIIALTANAVVGQAEMFLANGFDGFISKPIDIRELNAALNKYIRDKQSKETLDEAYRLKSEQESALPLETAHKRAPMSPASLYNRLFPIFVKDTKKALNILRPICDRGEYGEDDMQAYIIHVHSMKSALVNIGKKELSAFAAELETAAKTRNISAVKDRTAEFLDTLQTLIGAAPIREESADVDEDAAFLREKLLAVRSACEAYDKKSIKGALSELDGKNWSHKTKALLEQVAEHILHGDFEKAAQTVGGFVGDI